LEKYGYFEREIDRAVKVFGDLASVMSAWEARRWWITSINWDEETPNKPIPRDLLMSEMKNTPYLPASDLLSGIGEPSYDR
jgi:hypothetical protein